MNLQSTDFELFGLPARFAQDSAEVDRRWKALQKQAHPDRFVADGAASQRVAMQWSVRINEGYQRLKDPLKRAAYLCELSGAPIRAHDNTAMPADFLMQQMSWRETLDEADTAEALQALLQDTLSTRGAALANLAHLLDVQGDPMTAAQTVRCLMFMERFVHEVEERLDRISA